jgi:hypothetical protein
MTQSLANAESPLLLPPGHDTSGLERNIGT